MPRPEAIVCSSGSTMAVQPANRRAPGDELRPHTAARVVHPPDLGGGSWYTGRASSDLTDADAAKPDRGGALVDRLPRRATARSTHSRRRQSGRTEKAKALEGPGRTSGLLGEQMRPPQGAAGAL